MTPVATILCIAAVLGIAAFSLLVWPNDSAIGTDRTVAYLRSPGAESRAARDRLALLYEVHSWAACETCGLGPPPLELLERGFEPSIDTYTSDDDGRSWKPTGSYGRNFEFHKTRAS